jgi:predicted aldo/keto reductase-like oxidoreductase
MEYRTLGRTGLEVSAIGLGLEHIAGRKPREMAAVLETAAAGGITYVDLLYEDPASDLSQKFGGLLREHRDVFFYAAHWGGPNEYTPDYCRRTFEGVLEILGTDHVPVAMITMADTQAKWGQMRAQVEETLLGYKERGVIGAIGVSTHHAPTAVAMMESGLIDVLMLPIGLTKAALESGGAPEPLCRVYAAAHAHGVGLVSMKVYSGGGLLNRQHSQATPVQCLHYALSQPIATVAVGVQNAGEVRQALAYVDATDEEKDYIPAAETLRLDAWDACTQCQHCLPCPNGLDIPEIMRLAIMARWKLTPLAELRAEYARLKAKASNCEECRTCLERCAFGVDILERLATAREVLEG